MTPLHTQVVNLYSEVCRRKAHLHKKKTYQAAADLQQTQRERMEKIEHLRASFAVVEGGRC